MEDLKWPTHEQVQQKVTRRKLPFKFTGSGSEYFRIWIVNTVLSILTLGIYSAWAKVRAKQYFYRHTWLDGTSFEYDGDPLKILKGRAILGGFFVATYAASFYSIYLNFGLFLLLFIASPWLAIKSWAFNARNSSFRNVRFSFRGRLREAYTAYTGMSILSVLTLSLMIPYSHWRKASFKIGGHGYGTRRFKLAVTAGPFYGMYLISGAIASVGFGLIYGLFTLFLYLTFSPGVAIPDFAIWLSPFIEIIAPVVFYLPLAIPAAYLRATTPNLIYGNTHCDGYRLSSKQRTWPLLWIYLSNLILILVSFGLLIPWARIRLARYRIANLSLRTDDSFETKTDPRQSDPSAFGEAGVDLGGFDFGL